jgi:hypothetical protein
MDSSATPPPGAGEHFQSAHWLRDSNVFSVHSKPNGQKPDRRLADQDVIWKVILGHRSRLERHVGRIKGRRDTSCV